ncbi:MAG: hypothetical protein K6E12_02670 [Saccharofermentans sp.]|nr:hypothetical protein [Saccharofermentans sp.]
MSKKGKTKSDVIEDLRRIYRDIKDPALMSARDKNISIFILYVATICCRNETGKRKVRNEGSGSNGYKQLRGYTNFPKNVSGPCYVLFSRVMNEKKTDRSKVKPKDFDRLSNAVFYKYVVKIDGKETEDNNLWINDLLTENYVELLNNDSLIEEMKEDIDISGLDSSIDDEARKDCDKLQLFPLIKYINEKLAIDPWDRSKEYVERIVTRYEFHILEEHIDELEDYDDWFDAYKDLCLPKRLLDDLVRIAKGESAYMPITIYEVLSESLKQNLSAENDSRQKYAPLEYIRNLEERMQYRFDGISPTLIDDCYKDLIKRLDNSRNYGDCRKKEQREAKGIPVLDIQVKA